MKAFSSIVRVTDLKRKLMIAALLVGFTGTMPGCGCECVGLATAVTAASAAAPIIWVAREAQEARKTSLEIKKLESNRSR